MGDGEQNRWGGTVRMTRGEGPRAGRLRLRRRVTLRTRREKVVRGALVGGAMVLALLAVLSMCGGHPQNGTPAGGSHPRTPARPDFPVPAGYDPGRGWNVPEVSEDFTVAQAAGSVAVLQAAGPGRFRVRAIDVTTGRTRWAGGPTGPLPESWTRPRLLTVAKDGREFFVTWSYGDTSDSVLSGVRTAVSLDVYDAAYGTRRHVEVPWQEAPDVAGGGPGVLIGRGSDHAAVVDPVSGAVATTGAKDLAYPKGCRGCRQETDIRGLTSHGLLVRGAREFWVRSGWYGRRGAPRGTDPGSGVPASVTADRVLVTWRRKSGSKDAGTLETWAVHDAVTGKVLASADCLRGVVEPGRYPELALSFSGRYAVAGPLAFDLTAHQGHCFDEEAHGAPPDAAAPPAPPVDAVDPDDPATDDAPRPLTLITVTDQGVAYGTTGAHSAADARAGGGRPVQVALGTYTVRPADPTVHVPAADVGGYGLFPYTDTKDVQHLVGRPRRGAPGD